MQRKVFKSGNSMVVSIPKDYLELIGIPDGGDVSVSVDGKQKRIVIVPMTTPLEAVGVDEQFVQQVNEFIEQYRDALEALATGE